MRRIYFSIVSGILAVTTGVVSTSAGAVFNPQNHGAPPVFAVHGALPPATVGSKYTFNFCNPPAARACGGRFVPLQIDPSAGHGGPYVFTVRIGAGFLPKGLALGPRTGILTGIPVISAARNGQRTLYPFTVCASDSSGRRCNQFSLWVDPAPAPAQGVVFGGNWTGNYIKNQAPKASCPNALVINGAVNVTIAPIGDSYQVDIYFIGSDTTGCNVNVAGESRRHITMSHSAASTITGFSGADGYSLTFSGPNIILGTGVGDFGRFELTLNRVP